MAKVNTKNPCDICTETCKLVTCKCGLGACQACIRHYLIESINDPMCMGCKIPYDYEFLNTHLSKSWHNGAYKASRKAVLLDRELAKTPLAMQYIEQCETVARLDADFAASLVLTDELCKIYTNIPWSASHNTSEERGIARTNYFAARLQSQNLRHELHRARRIASGVVVVATPVTDDTSKTQLLYGKCPVSDCPGMLDQNRVCVTCRTATCDACFEIKDPKSHTCDPDTLETVKMIKVDTKPCPKCSTPIHKIEGCYQMWCTKCHTTFHYQTLEILRETIHNPHYIEYMAQARLDVHAADNGHNHNANDQIWRLQDSFPDVDERIICMIIHRFNVHVLQIVLPTIAEHMTRPGNTPQKMRVRLADYLQGRMTAAKLQTALYSDYKQRQRWTSMQELWTMFTNMTHIFIENAIVSKNMETFLDVTEQLIKYTNAESVRINQGVYNNAVPYYIEFQKIYRQGTTELSYIRLRLRS
jgi:hypothetical protein